MICEKIDLYAYFGLERKQNQRGYLYTYARVPNGEEPPTKRRPAMLILPGGGYAMVSDREAEPVALFWTSLGYNCFVLNYSIAPEYYPTQLTEAALAVWFIKQNAEKFAIDTNFVAAIGFSAGAHLCAMLSQIGENKDIKLGCENKELQPNAVLLCYGVLSCACGHARTFENVSNGGKIPYKKVDPSVMVTANTAPTFLWTTVNDNCVPFENSMVYAMELSKNSVPFELHVFRKGRHGLSVATADTAWPDGEGIDDNIAEWKTLAKNWLESLGYGVHF